MEREQTVLLAVRHGRVGHSGYSGLVRDGEELGQWIQRDGAADDRSRTRVCVCVCTVLATYCFSILYRLLQSYSYLCVNAA